ncbi:MAG: TetR/AcrR family transcriptional regulator [Actinomycetota bacterium]|nr:TetR/AcrR family transcriptional regulator [Actinomycetota bacterium]
MSPSSGRSIRSGQRGREVLDAAAAVFAHRGYEATSLDDIADALGATKGLIYHHYRSKEDLLLGVLVTGAETLTAAVQPIAEGAEEPVPRLRAMAREHARLTMVDLDYQRTAFRALPQHIFVAERSTDDRWNRLRELRGDYEELFLRVIEEIQRGTGAEVSADPKTLTRATLGTLNWVNVWFRAEREPDVERLADQLADFVVSGVVAAAGAQAIGLAQTS